jgi:hypothetical protein
VDYHISATQDYYPETDYGEVLKSVDGGANWSCLLCAVFWNNVLPPPVGRLAIASGSADTSRAVYVADLYNNVFKTIDDGRTWIQHEVTCCGAIDSLAVDPHNPDTVFAVVSYPGVFKSVDGGTSWTAIGTGFLDTVFAGIFLVDPQDSTNLYAGTTFGLFKSADAGASWNPTDLVQHSPLGAVTIDPVSVAAGESTTGTVRLLTPAPAEGITVAVSIDSPVAATAPATVTVPAGATTADFTISTGLGLNGGWVTVFVCHLDATKATQFLVKPRLIPTSLALYPSTVTAGTNSTGGLTLSADVPEGGAVVGLSSSDPGIAKVPPTVLVPAGPGYAWFTISTASVVASTTVTISATYNNVTTSALLTVNPAVTFGSLGLSSTAVIGGSPSIGTAILSAAAPATASAAAPALYTAGLAMCLVNFVFARLVFAPFYQGLRPDTLVRTEFFGLAPLVLGMLLLAVATWLLIPHLGVFALVPLTVVVIGPQLAFRHLSRRRSVASMERLDAERLYAQAIGDLMGLPRERRRALACASELAAGRYRRWRIEDAMRYSNADLSGAIPIALHAEERWDGAGDPAGLEGAQAPVESRILGVARRWSDLTARGTPELPHSEALLGLAALSGSELDPGIVAAAQRVVAQEEIFVGVPDFEPRLHRLPLPRSARRGAVPALLGKLAAAD